MHFVQRMHKNKYGGINLEETVVHMDKICI
jgi:hypothetical protein